MFRRFSANFAVLSIFLDALVVDLALLIAALMRVPLSTLPFVREMSKVDLPWQLYLIFPALWVGVMMLFSVYDGRKNLKVVDEFTSIGLAFLLTLVSMAGVLYLSFRDVSRFLFLFFAFTAFICVIGWRTVSRVLFRFNWLRPSERRRVLVLGYNQTSVQLEKEILRQPYTGLALVGFLDDDPAVLAENPYILGRLDKVRNIVTQMHVDDVVVALPMAKQERLIGVVSVLHDLPVKVWVIPDYFSLALHKAQVEEFGGIPMLDLRAPALSEYQRMVKRGFDLVVTILGMPFVLPLLSACALAIRLDSPGPIFYRAKRVGENGKLFDMIKFRTMVENADQLRNQVEKVDQNGNVIFKSADDPRITRVGKFLRKTSLDEFPQLINVLKGEMSLVGPRPEQPYLVEQYQLWQRKRFAVPQGLTGWWQINGRSDRPMHLHTEDDLYYVQHYSIWLDLEILFKTVWVVLRGKGAY
jgi:exopolysaccharide biosynthesis polyprenyl glycosylphosphotransferase